MKAQCLPFERIPHTTRLFLDYLAHAPSVRPFYPRSPIFPEWLREEARRVVYDEARRAKVGEILKRQNRGWGASEKTLANIERLKNGALTAVTGQQVGLFGGPLFSIFKALSAVKLAEEATAAGVECVPIFWLATEDHDLAEVNHVALAGERGAPEKFSVADSALKNGAVTDAPVGTVKFGDEITPVVERAAALLGDSEAASWLRSTYRPGETFGSAFARLFVRMFAEWGVILLDPADKGFHDLAKPLLRAAVERAGELDEALMARGKAIEAAGYHQQVKVTVASTLLFEVKDGARTAVRRQAHGVSGDEFAVGDETASAGQLLAKIEAAPEEFNPNVLLRPVVQDFLLPTLVYAGGAAEVAYFAQASVVYEKLLGRVTPILPRFSATLIEPKAERLLTRYELGLPDLFQGPEALGEAIAARSLPAELRSRFAAAYANAEDSMKAVRESVGRLDATLVEAADRARVRMWHQINRLQRRASRAELLGNEIISRHAGVLSVALFPNKALQEREVAGVSFLARFGPELLAHLHQNIQTDCHDHQLIEVG